MTPNDFRFFYRLRVRWAEVDLHKGVFHAHYLMYFDAAMADYWRALAVAYDGAMQQLGGCLHVKKATVEFFSPARLDDALQIGLKCTRVGNSSLSFHGTIFRGEQRLIDGELIHVFADAQAQAARPLPPALRELLVAYEAGEPPVELRTGSWAELAGGARDIRTQVFIEEQGIPATLEWDDDDAHALHAVAYNRLGQPVGTARLLPAQQGVARIGRLSVNRALRGMGIGRTLLCELATAAAQRGDQAVRLHAQRNAQAFYSRMGFEPVGEAFDEAGIEHHEMMAPLPLPAAPRDSGYSSRMPL